jgi:hypothetical protein
VKEREWKFNAKRSGDSAERCHFKHDREIRGGLPTRRYGKNCCLAGVAEGVDS